MLSLFSLSAHGMDNRAYSGEAIIFHSRKNLLLRVHYYVGQKSSRMFIFINPILNVNHKTMSKRRRRHLCLGFMEHCYEF